MEEAAAPSIHSYLHAAIYSSEIGSKMKGNGCTVSNTSVSVFVFYRLEVDMVSDASYLLCGIRLINR